MARIREIRVVFSAIPFQPWLPSGQIPFQANIDFFNVNLRAEVGRSAAEVRGFITLARDILKRSLGNQYSSSWNVTGFTRSLEIPPDEDEAQSLIASLQSYFAANPAQENAGLNMTAARAGELFSALSDARSAVNNQGAVIGTAKGVRGEAVAELRTRLRGLIAELQQLLDDHDPRWLAFGLNKPGAPAIPDVPSNLRLDNSSAGRLLVSWDPSARAEHYRVWKPVLDSDTEPIAVGSPHDTDFTIESLPSQRQVSVFVSAVNEGGESQRANGAHAIVA